MINIAPQFFLLCEFRKQKYDWGFHQIYSEDSKARDIPKTLFVGNSHIILLEAEFPDDFLTLFVMYFEGIFERLTMKFCERVSNIFFN